MSHHVLCMFLLHCLHRLLSTNIRHVIDGSNTGQWMWQKVSFWYVYYPLVPVHSGGTDSSLSRFALISELVLGYHSCLWPFRKLYMQMSVCSGIALVSEGGQLGSALMWSRRHFQTQLVADGLLNSVKRAALSGRTHSCWTFPAPPHAFSLTLRTSPGTDTKYINTQTAWYDWILKS